MKRKKEKKEKKNVFSGGGLAIDPGPFSHTKRLANVQARGGAVN